MTEIKDGGAAFPGCVRNTKGKLDRNPGMSLRDWFAGQLAASTVGGAISINIGIGEEEMLTVAKSAYKFADAMLEAREQADD